MKLKVLLSLALIAAFAVGCSTYPPNGTAITLSYPEGTAPEQVAPDEEVTDELGADTRGSGTATVRGLKVINDAQIGGTLNMATGMVFEGATANEFETVFAPVDPTADNTVTIQNASGIMALTTGVVLAKTETYNVLAADTGKLFKLSGSFTVNLPAAAAGLNFCFVNYDGGDQVIDFTDATDVAINEVNSPGDSVTNTTAFDNICLYAIDATNWATISSIGTWADGN